MHPYLKYYEDWCFFLELMKQGREFEWHIKGSKNYIILDGNKFENIFHFKRVNFSLISKVKKDARIYSENNNIENENLRANFFKKFSQKPDFKIDIKAAYWNAAKDIFLSDETYNLGINDKNSRLVALGSLATKHIIRYYKGGFLIDTKEEKGKYANIYFKICNRIDDVCNIVSNYCLGYWVDCFFCKEDQVENVKDLLVSFGFEFSEEIVYNFKIDNNKMIINDKPYPFI